MTELEEFHRQLISDTQIGADSDGLMIAESFFENMGDLLTEAGEIEEASRAYFTGNYSRGPAQIDGYGGDPRSTDGVLCLILCDFELTEDVRILNKADVERFSNRLYRFLQASLDTEFRDQIEETSVGFGLADLIYSTWNHIQKIKLIVITNADYRARTDGAKVQEIDGKPVTLSVWDLKRIKHYEEQGNEREDLIVNFEEEFGGSIPLLQAFGGDTALESYLAMIPGKQLAAIYEKWGPRLLESNVRSFLQARGKVNRGIRDTIQEEPHMFFSYNNGLSATADKITTEQSGSGLNLVSAENLQIVNGGQTTATVHAALKLNEEKLDQVYVQMKLTIVPPKESEAVVPKISQYANSQNRVNAADFFANHPFHIQIEEFSRRVLAPAGTGNMETKWFYERARGQYADERGRRTPGNRKKFDLEFPRKQFFTKTDLAKYENTFECLPHTVSLGAQKNFSAFAKEIGKRWGKEGSAFDELWYKRMIARAIIFKSTEKLVSDAKWYSGGYRANIVTYAIAKVAHDAKTRGKVIDLDTIWRHQEISRGLSTSLTIAGESAQEIILNPVGGIRNSSEWAKKQACWHQLSSKNIIYNDDLKNALTTEKLAIETAQEFSKESDFDEGLQIEMAVIKLGGEYWTKVLKAARKSGILTPKELGVIEICAKIPNKMPSQRQCEIAMSALKKSNERGIEIE